MPIDADGAVVHGAVSVLGKPLASVVRTGVEDGRVDVNVSCSVECVVILVVSVRVVVSGPAEVDSEVAGVASIGITVMELVRNT